MIRTNLFAIIAFHDEPANDTLEPVIELPGVVVYDASQISEPAVNLEKVAAVPFGRLVPTEEVGKHKGRPSIFWR
jgi:hypothetical protein